MTENTAQADQISAAVRKAMSHWSKSGLHGPSRRRKADELRDHLEAAVADGRDVRDVVGSDVVAFAAEWAQADRERNWIEPILFLVANVTLWLGLLALLWPLLDDDRDSLGMPAGLALSIELAMFYSFAIWLVRWFRAQLTKLLAVMLYGLLAGTYLTTVVVVMGPINRLDSELEMSPAVVTALIIVGLSFQALSSWMKRTNRF